MASPGAPESPVLLVCGEEEFAVKQRARAVYDQWTRQLGGTDHEVIDAAVNNAGEALKALARLREALQTLPFFGGAKAVWLQNCSFLGEERAAIAKDVTEALADLAAELKNFRWEGVRLLVSAGKVDKRKVFYKTLEKLGEVEAFAGWSAEDKDWHSQAEAFARRALRDLGKEISDEALAELTACVGPHLRLLSNEIEKLALFAGDRARLESADVEAVVARNKEARAFALADALGARDLPQALRCLDTELWEIRRDSKRSEIGLLYSLISKVRAMLLAKEMIARKWLRAGNDFNSFKGQLARVPADALPEDRQFNPLAINPFVLFKAAGQASRYTAAELVAAMDLLLECNLKLVSRDLDAAMVLQQALVQIVGPPPPRPLRAAA